MLAIVASRDYSLHGNIVVLVDANSPSAVSWPAISGMKKYIMFSCGLLCLTAVAAAADPLPPLRIAANQRVFVDAQDRPIFLLGDTAWALVVRLKREEITAYLEHRRRQGFNAIAAVLYAPENTEIAYSPVNIYGHSPFAAAGGSLDPLHPLTVPGADPAEKGEYDYWDHVDFAVAETKRLGFYLLLLPCWGNEVVYVVNPASAKARDARPRLLAIPDNARAYGRWLGQRYAHATHIAWMMGGDRSAVDARSGADFRPAFRAMAAGLKEAAPAALLSYHPQKAGLQSRDWFHDDEWLAFNSIQLWPEAQVGNIARDWNAKPTKPTWIFEGRYEGYWKSGYKPEEWGEWQMRQQAWQTVFAGGFGFTYGHERVFAFGATGSDWRAFLDTPGAGSMTHLASFMRTLDPEVALSRMPDQALLAGSPGRADRLRSDLIVASRTPDGRFAMVYIANGRMASLKLSALKGPLSAAWFNPRSGRWHAGGTESAKRTFFVRDLAAGPGAPDRDFDPPGEAGDGNDWVLVLRADD